MKVSTLILNCDNVNFQDTSCNIYDNRGIQLENSTISKCINRYGDRKVKRFTLYQSNNSFTGYVISIELK